MGRVIILFSMVWLLSCKCQQLSPTIEQRHDSSYTETIRLVPVGIPADKTAFSVTIKCDPITKKVQPFKYSAVGKRSKLVASLDTNQVLSISSNCDSLTELVSVKDTQIRLLQSRKEVIPEIQYRAFWYDKIARWFALVALLYIAFKLIKFFR